MIKCYFLDVKSIISDVPRSNFVESKLEKIADSILESDGLICPLVVEEIGVNKYTVIDGHQEYYAAVIAKEKNIGKAEMVNAFVIPANTRSSAIEQLNLLKQSSPHPVVTPAIDRHTLTEILSSTIDRLLPAISASIATQLEPMILQLAEQKQLLDAIESQSKSKKENKVKDTSQPPKAPTKRRGKSQTETNLESGTAHQQSDSIADSSVQSTKSSETKKAANKARKASKPEAKLPPNFDIVELTQQPELTVASSVKITDDETKITSNSPGSSGLDKSTNALNLINTLDLVQLQAKLERSGVCTAKTCGKLVETIITNRSIQPTQKFESWDAIAAAKITGLGSAVVKKIIDKLK